MSRGQTSVNISGTNISMKLPVKSSHNQRKNRNDKKSKVANDSTLKNTTRPSGVDEKKASSQKTVQDPVENRFETEKTKKVSFVDVPVTLTGSKCMGDFKEQRIINPNNDVSSNTRETLPGRMEVNLRPCYDKIPRFYNYDPSTVDDRTANRSTSSLRHSYANHTQTGNWSDVYRRPQNSERYQNCSKSFNYNDNADSRNNGRFNNINDGHQMNNIPEHEGINSNTTKRTVVHFSLSKKTVELNTCENAWKPSRRDTQKPTETNETQIEEIQKKVRSILNKITPETMVILTKNIVEMQITTYECLEKIIEILFEKAIDEPNFTPQYAYICSQMQNIEVMSKNKETKTSFRQLIVLKCQETFELVSAVEKKAVKKLSEITSCKDQGLKEELQSKYDESERIQRKRSVGNCRFMCELFRVKLLNSNILQMCIRHLLKFPKEEPLECLCNILKQIGKHLNPEKTFEKLQEFVSKSYKTRISSRIRFMIQDTIDLKKNDWVPRNVVIKPKTLNEIAEEFTMVPTSNRMSSKYALPIDRPFKNYTNSNTKKDNMCDKNEVQSTFEKREVENNLVTDNSEIKLNTCKNAWVPRFRSSQKSVATSDVKIEDSCETINSTVFSITKENIVSSTNNLILRISSVDMIEETIDVLFKRAITEPSSVLLLVEICSLLKGIVLSTDKGATHVSFKKKLAARCHKLLQMGIPNISRETYTMVGELFNKKLVPLNILVELITDIPNQLTDASIENICYLLKIIGAEIERPYSLKPTLKLLEAYVKNDTEGLVSSEHKDDVLCLLKLRNNKWIPIKPIDPLPTPEKTELIVSRSDMENPSSIPEERKRGKNRRKKNMRKLLSRENSDK